MNEEDDLLDDLDYDEVVDYIIENDDLEFFDELTNKL